MTDIPETLLADGSGVQNSASPRSPGRDGFAMLAVLAGAAASLLPDPILPVPLAWGLLMQRTGIDAQPRRGRSAGGRERGRVLTCREPRSRRSVRAPTGRSTTNTALLWDGMIACMYV